MGQAIRATAQDARAARVLGIDTEKVYSFTFCLNAAICGAAGALVAVVWNVQPFMGRPIRSACSSSSPPPASATFPA